MGEEKKKVPMLKTKPNCEEMVTRRLGYLNLHSKRNLHNLL